MTKEQVIAWARECGADVDEAANPAVYASFADMQRFAKLVRNEAVIEERKALAEVCDAMGSPHIAEYLREQAAAIESLKEQTP